MDCKHIDANLPGKTTSESDRINENVIMSFDAAIAHQLPVANIANPALHTSSIERNKHLTINRIFPAEVLSHTLLLVGPPSNRDPYPYLPLSWVCHYWRNLILHNPAFWTFILISSQNYGGTRGADHPPLVKESILRSKTLMLDVVIYGSFMRFSNSHIAFFNSECGRIHSLQLDMYVDPRTDPLELYNGSFPSLRHLFLGRLGNVGRLWTFIARLENLRTLQCTSPNIKEVDQLVRVFNRLVRLSITTPRYFPSDSFHNIIASLHNNPVLKELSLQVEHEYRYGSNNDGLTFLPALQVLWTNCWPAVGRICAPKLSHLKLHISEFAALRPQEDRHLLEHADFSSVKYIDVKDHPITGSRNDVIHYCSVEGSKDPAYPEDHLMNFLDFFSQRHSRDHFLFQFQYGFSAGLSYIIATVLPRVPNLSVLRLRLADGLYDIEEILENVPSLETLIVDDGDHIKNFIRVLKNTALCPCLKELSYMSYWVPKDLERFAEIVGEGLTSVLQLRQESGVNQLKSIIMKNCPPLPNIWLEKLRSLGTEIVTATDFASVTRRTSV